MEVDMIVRIVVVAAIVLAFIVFGILIFYASLYKKVHQGKAIIRNGVGGTKVSFTGLLVLPVFHHHEIIDIDVKRVEIDRSGVDGLICKDNMRADIRVAFFVRVNQTAEDVLKVAQSLGVAKASDPKTLREFFDAKFSEALKTVGKGFEFVQLYTERVNFKNEILQVIGTDLNGYILDDAAIDYLEQTSLDHMNPDNIMDSEGIKKITEITSRERVLANQIEKDKEKTIVQQNVEAKEAILELEKQQAEAEQKQKREIAAVTSREEAEAARISHEERLKAESARIRSDEELGISEENKQRQIIVAQKAKERTTAVETERVEKDAMLERTEKEKIVSLAQIEKEKAVEEEQKNIQEVIRQRVMVQKAVVEEQERIKDTEAFAAAERTKKVALTKAEEEAQQHMIKEQKAAEASKIAAQELCEQQIMEADAKFKASEKEAEARKTIADAQATEEATLGMSEVRVMEAKADAVEKEGKAEARVIEMKAVAEAKGLEAKAIAIEKQGIAEASVMSKKYSAEAVGIEEKANAMKKLDGVGKEHEEFKLRLEKDKEIELAEIGIRKDIADAQANVIQEGLKSAHIDIVGGESMFIDKVMGAIGQGKTVDRLVGNSDVLSDVKETFFSGDPEYFKEQLADFIAKFSVSSEDVKNLTLSALIGKMMTMADGPEKSTLSKILSMVKSAGLGKETAKRLGLA